MTSLLFTGAVVCSAAGFLAAAAVLAGSRDVRQAAGVLLDFLLAAGLLRLSTDASWSALATAGIIVVIRKVLMSTGSPRPRVGVPAA